MSTGHTTYTTFHADSVGEVLKRFTTEPINVSKTLFTALDLVSVQRQTRVKGRKVRRSSAITEINDYSAENDEINVKDVYQWRADTDEFERLGRSNLLDQIMFDRGWSNEELQAELSKRRIVLAYLIDNHLNQYAQVAATLQAFMSDPETLLTLVAHGALESSLRDLREMESVLIDIDPEKEALVPRPDPPEEIAAEATDVLESVEATILEQYRDSVPESGAIERMLRKAAEASEDVALGAIERSVEAPAPEADGPTIAAPATADTTADEEESVGTEATAEVAEPVGEARTDASDHGASADERVDDNDADEREDETESEPAPTNPDSSIFEEPDSAEDSSLGANGGQLGDHSSDDGSAADPFSVDFEDGDTEDATEESE